jgi:hypothetical protein
MESLMVPETVQLIVEVAGLCAWAPAFDVMRPAGIAPRRKAHRNNGYHSSRFLRDSSTSASARAVRTVDRIVDDVAALGLQPVLFVPDVQGRFLESNLL